MAELWRRKMPGIEVNKLTPENAEAVTLWCGGLQVEEIDVIDPEQRFVGINVATGQGMRRASEGDYIVRELNGLFNVFKPGDFQSLYEPVT